MKRKHLVRERQQLDGRLRAQRAGLQRRSDESWQALQRVPTWQLLAAGFAAGIIAGRLGWRRTYSIGRLGARWYPLLQAALIV